MQLVGSRPGGELHSVTNRTITKQIQVVREGFEPGMSRLRTSLVPEPPSHTVKTKETK